MKNTQFSPGPCHIVRLEGRTVFRLYLPETTSESQAEANRRLITAAPDLFSALSDLLSECEQYRGFDHNAGLLVAARNAIAKATGNAIPTPAISENLNQPL